MKPFPKPLVAVLRRSFLTIFVCFISCALSPQGKAVDYWVAPTGNSSLTTNSATYPMAYTTANVQTIIETNPKSSGQSNVTIYFKWGTYEIDRLTLPSATPTNRHLYLRAQDPAVPPVFRYQVPTGSNLFNGQTYHTWLFELGNRVLARFEASDLTIDANWPAWTATNTAAHPAYGGAFKLGGLWVQAHAGKVSGLRIKNCGAKGEVPVPHFGGAGGAESFPLFVEAQTWGANL